VRRSKSFAASAYFAAHRFHAGKLLREDFPEELDGDFPPVVEHALGRADPLPDLRARDLGGRRVLHQVEHRHAAVAREPGAEVLDADRDVVAQPRLGDRLLRPEVEQVLRRDGDLRALPAVLVGRRHVLVEHLLRHRHEARVRDPGAVAAVGDLAQLVLTHLLQRRLVRRRVVLDRDLRRHAAHRRRAAAVAGLHQQQRVGAHERREHGHLAAVGEAEILVGAELLDAGKDVVPAADVEPGRVAAQLVEDLVHLEGGEHRLDERGRADASLRDPQLVLGKDEDVVPQARLEVRLHLRQIEIRARAARQQLPRVVEEEQREVEDRARDCLAVDPQVLLVEVPAARPRDQHRGAVLQAVVLAALLEADGALHGVAQVDLAVDHVVPGRAVGVLEVRHEGRSAGIERVDHHLAVGRSRNFNPAIDHVLRDRGTAPVRLANLFRSREKIGELPGVEPLLSLVPGAQGFAAPRSELSL